MVFGKNIFLFSFLKNRVQEDFGREKALCKQGKSAVLPGPEPGFVLEHVLLPVVCAGCVLRNACRLRAHRMEMVLSFGFLFN